VARRASQVIAEHASDFQDLPLFLYLAFSTPHFPLQVPDAYSDMYPDVVNQARKIFSGTTVLSEGIILEWKDQL
jgi:hypothetical protein